MQHDLETCKSTYIYGTIFQICDVHYICFNSTPWSPRSAPTFRGQDLQGKKQKLMTGEVPAPGTSIVRLRTKTSQDALQVPQDDYKTPPRKSALKKSSPKDSKKKPTPYLD